MCPSRCLCSRDGFFSFLLFLLFSAPAFSPMRWIIDAMRCEDTPRKHPSCLRCKLFFRSANWLGRILHMWK
jgi:hypothetical protein